MSNNEVHSSSHHMQIRVFNWEATRKVRVFCALWMGQKVDALPALPYDQGLDYRSQSKTMKRCPTCNKDFPDDANFCPVDAGHLIMVDSAAPVPVPRVDTGGNELLDGRFILGEIVGGHRSGPVYQAADKQGSAAMVKLVAAEVFPTALLKQRTERELKQLEQLDHVGVAKVLSHGRRDDALWIATERVDGVTLDNFISQTGPLPQQRAVGIVLQIGAALEAAAKLGVTHRDLSPKNILVGEGDQIKLINFGVPVPGPEGREAVQGVSEYVAPEQIEGRPVDQRCNIYSLGAITTLLLTGAPPFTGSPLEVLGAHSATQVPLLGANQGVTTELGAALLKSLEKTSSKRFMTLRQFLGEIEKDAAAPATASKSSDVNKTLMGIATTDLKAAMAAAKAEAVGTPAPPVETPAPVETLAPATLAGAAGATEMDHAPPVMVSPAASPSPAVSPAAFPSPAISPSPASPSPASPSPASPRVAAGAGGKRAGAKTPQAAAEEVSKNKGKFRETMWFKKGELDEAAARAAAQAKPEAGVSSKADEMEMDVRYSDDGSITEQDKDRLSLRTGATMMMEAVPKQAPIKHRVSEDDLVSEMTAGRNKILIGMGIALVALGIFLAIMLS